MDQVGLHLGYGLVNPLYGARGFGPGLFGPSAFGAHSCCLCCAQHAQSRSHPYYAASRSASVEPVDDGFDPAECTHVGNGGIQSGWNACFVVGFARDGDASGLSQTVGSGPVHRLFSAAPPVSWFRPGFRPDGASNARLGK